MHTYRKYPRDLGHSCVICLQQLTAVHVQYHWYSLDSALIQERVKASYMSTAPINTCLPA